MKVWFKSLVLILILNLISLFAYADTYPERDYPEGSFPKYSKVAYHFTPGYQQEKRQWFKAIKLIYENHLQQLHLIDHFCNLVNIFDI